MARAPEQAAGDQVQIARVGDGDIIVAQGGGEDFGLVVVGVGPDDDVVIHFFFAVAGLAGLLAAGQGFGGVVHLADDVVVEFFADGGPVFHPFGDGAFLVGEGD